MTDPIDTPRPPVYYLAYAPGHRPGIVELVHQTGQEQHWRCAADTRMPPSPQNQEFTVISIADILANQDRLAAAKEYHPLPEVPGALVGFLSGMLVATCIIFAGALLLGRFL